MWSNGHMQNLLAYMIYHKVDEPCTPYIMII